MRTNPDHGEQSYRGAGRAVALAFAREGADVGISYLPKEESDARESARWVREAGRKAVTLPGDIRDEMLP